VNISEERRKFIEFSEKASSNEHRYSSLMADLEDSRLSCEQLERTRRDLEAQLHDALEKIADLQTQNSSMSSYKYQFSIELESVREDYELSLRELRETKDKYNKCLLDLQRVSEELKQEQEHSLTFVSVRKSYETQIKEITYRLEQAEVNGTSGSKRELTKLQNRIRELEASLEEEARRYNEAVKETRTNSRRLKELASESEDDKRRIIQLQEAVEALNKKLKAYRKQCEETEEIAALNLHKYRKAIQEQEDAMERADIAENNLNKMRCYNRSSVSMSRSSVPRDVGSSTVTFTTRTVKRAMSSHNETN